MLETGQPLHAFDGEKLRDRKIIVRFAKDKEKIVTLDGEKYDLYKDILVIADSKLPIAIAGIKGGKEPEIDRKTKTVVIESANFNQKIIRKGSKSIDLKTDASLRFEHGIDPDLTEITINRAVSLIQEIAGGKIARGLVDFYPRRALSKKIILDLNYAEELLGVKIPKSEIIKTFKNLGFKVFQSSSQKLKVEIPTRRLDIYLPEDLIEEIGRIQGYKKIPAKFPLAALLPPKRNDQIFWENLSKRALKELSFTEVYNYSFGGEELREIFGYKRGELIEIENPVSIKQKYLRPSLIPNLLVNLKINLKNFSEIRIFELGKIYEKKGKGAEEKRIIAGAVFRKESKSQAEIFFELKGTVDSLLNQLGISDIWYDFYKPTPEESKLSFWQIKKSAEIKIGRVEIGFLGAISSKILEELKINENLAIFEIDFETLSQLCSEEHEFRPLSRYPSAVRDLAVLVPRRVLVEEVLNIINTAGGKVVRDVDIFDIYEGEEMPEGKKNLAFHIIYQAEDRTLNSLEIDRIHQKIIKALEKKLEWQVRK
ncbi:MAG: phenylalanine--tRNA ligase subunit beta [Candidatus Nealsonbacteria bacterium RBG_13_36_15]|uniref:Phenylalanine--tRNA ligase beta subunit n=1 Tax=Candidatus Nealsonbacteria bacterium RBG_13_36_15 TaxID=1801660 RepID=A0A1G2DUP3_9BACT|nr:MAG: phenylalanine--tRNA ligase subunit beta [Candidatus Nealsonbacteria bacterium RBG_13_36_15]